MGAEVLIKVENIKKKFCRSLKRSMLYGVQDISKDILGLDNKSENLRKDEFWSLDDISFEVKKGECLGIIGANGAGKSTLLKILTGIILPDDGKVTTKGKVGALIEVGSGFHPMLSGRENIYINGSILGMSKKKLDEKFDSIVKFAELEDSIDMPVKHYSSGMYVRLGFAIASHVEPDILILDEILAVGDMAFKAKCFKHIVSIRERTAIIFVSHDMKNISRICDKVLYIQNSKKSYIGNPIKAINLFRETMTEAENRDKYYNDNNIEIRNFNAPDIIEQFKSIEIDLQYYINGINNYIVSLSVHREDGVQCFRIVSELQEIENTKNKQLVKSRLILEKIMLMPGRYNITLAFFDENQIVYFSIFKEIKKITITGVGDAQGVYYPEYKWHIDN